MLRSDLEQDPDAEQDPDPLFHETDPRIRIWIHIKMKRIRNTAIRVLRAISSDTLFKVCTFTSKTKILIFARENNFEKIVNGLSILKLFHLFNG